MAKQSMVRLTANFERNLVDVERFPTTAEALQADNARLDKLLDPEPRTVSGDQATIPAAATTHRP